jgi:drug/metabolite transporter (DMT)-like permease
VWSATLRYAYMILMLLAWQLCAQGAQAVRQTFQLFFSYWKFWTIAGSIGFGGFYSLICFSADHAPGWVVATTWQLTIIASLIVLIGFGRSCPRRTWGFSLIIFIGVLMVNLSQVETAQVFRTLLKGGLPVLIAAFCYPIGNQLVWEAQKGRKLLPHIKSPVLHNPFSRVFLLSLGSVPFWLVLLAVNTPPSPSQGQLINTALVALFSGVCATSLFLYARNQSKKASELAAVDATQSSEVIFALFGEVLILGAPLPSLSAWAGILIVFGGLALFIRFQELET